MNFGDKLKSERTKRNWSQDYLAEKIFVSRQSVSKWETNKNYPSIEVIISLSDLFDISIDELLRSDKGLEEKIIKDSKGTFNFSFQKNLLTILGVVLGIILVSVIKNNEINWLNIGEVLMKAIISLYLVTLFFPNWKEISFDKK